MGNFEAQAASSLAGVEFQLEDIAFSADVMAYNGGDASLQYVRVKSDGSFRGPLVTNKKTLVEALQFHARH
ncbi:hypothetical protein [Arthrobacter sp. SAFR-179]|uniref:hypothetical protein n=1 Tax=Arthrobacter sp. SAFR-179 TaxID=3387279 RepID=UPI003F7BB39B